MALTRLAVLSVVISLAACSPTDAKSRCLTVKPNQASDFSAAPQEFEICAPEKALFSSVDTEKGTVRFATDGSEWLNSGIYKIHSMVPIAVEGATVERRQKEFISSGMREVNAQGRKLYWKLSTEAAGFMKAETPKESERVLNVAVWEARPQSDVLVVAAIDAGDDLKSDMVGTADRIIESSFATLFNKITTVDDTGN